MAEIKVRIALDDDHPVVFDLVETLLRELGEEGDELGKLDRRQVSARWASFRPLPIAFLAEDASGRAVGAATVSCCFAIYAGGDYGVINEMYVEPPFRSSGVGRMLLDSVAAHARAQGWKRLDVTAPESERWQRTRRFYEANGFVYTGPKLKLLLD